MIVDALLWIVNRLSVALLTTINGFGGWATADPPDWVDGTVVERLFEGASTMGAWLPVQFGLSCVVAVLACKFVGLIVKMVRIVASFLTAGGGSAA